jgi:hypothetical protein
MKVKNVDLLVVLGSQIIQEENGVWKPAEHTAMKIEAAVICWKRKLSEKFFISGGYNVGIRYNPKQILQPPNFSFEALAKARWLGPSEAQVICEEMVKKGVPQEKIFLEELSTTSEENAEMLRIILKRTTFQGIKKIGIMSLLYHLQRVASLFKERIPEVDFLLAEDLLAMDGQVGRVVNFYQSPRGGQEWPYEKIRELLSLGRSLKEML